MPTATTNPVPAPGLATAFWPVDLTPDETEGNDTAGGAPAVLARIVDLDAYTGGPDTAAALAAAADLLEEWVLGAMAHGREVPSPSPATGRHGTMAVVALPAQVAIKLEIYRAMRAQGLNKAQLAARVGWQPSEVTRLFDGRHATRLDKIEAALAALGRRLVLTSEAA